jgi:hypothetical protein
VGIPPRALDPGQRRTLALMAIPASRARSR